VSTSFWRPFHPQGPSRSLCRRRRGLNGRLSGPHHGNGHRSDGGWARFHPFGFGPGGQSRKATSAYCQYSVLLVLSSSSKRQIST
jgi:hypothetical protein